ncbi:MAG: sugar phosphate isomerase/epimerase family protein [Acutalibacteraceae bacterium]|nr:sugar phosphate isomerase/epimerase family protein [Acutalibacteraceae bacterium]
MNYFKLGLCSVTFRKKAAEDVVNLAKKAGIGFIEWGGDIHVKAIDDAKMVKALCDKADIKISSYGSYFNSAVFDVNKWIEACEIAKVMGAKSIRIWLGKKNSQVTSDKEYQLLLENTKKMCDIASEYGLIVCPECHDNTFNNNTDAILRFVNELKRDNFRTYFQSRYFRMEYDLDRIDRTYDYIKDVHISYRDLKREQLFRKKDKNYLDTLLKKFKEKAFDGIVMIEFVSGNSEKNFFNDTEKLKRY